MFSGAKRIRTSGRQEMTIDLLWSFLLLELSAFSCILLVCVPSNSTKAEAHVVPPAPFPLKSSSLDFLHSISVECRMIGIGQIFDVNST
jgi:hypothetical protein